MKRLLPILLVFSLALNVGLVSASIMHWSDAHRAGRDWRSGGPGPDGRPGDGPAFGGGGPGHGARLGHPGFLRGPGAERIFAHWPERRAERMAQRLGLSPEQHEALRAELAGFRDRMGALTRELAETRFATAELLAADQVDGERVREGMLRARTLQSLIDSLAAEAMLREASVLDPEQRRRFLEMQWMGRGR